MDIENWPINKPIPFARNARKLSPRAVDKVAASIREFGFRQPVVVDKAGTIICGHTRLQAAQKLGLVEVPVHVAQNLTPAQVRAYRLMDNRSHQESDWDLELLGPEMLELRDLAISVSPALTCARSTNCCWATSRTLRKTSSQICPRTRLRKLATFGFVARIGYCVETLARKTPCRACVGQHALT